MSTELWCIIWIFNVYLKQDSWDRQTRKLEPAGEGFGAIRPYTQRTPSLFTLHQAELNSCAAEPAAGWNTAEGYRCVRTSERKRLILQPLSLAKTEEDRHGSLRTDPECSSATLLAPTQTHQTAMDCKNTTGQPEETNITNVEIQRDY